MCTSVTSCHVGVGGECAPVSQVAMLEWGRVCTSVTSCHARGVRECAPVSQVALLEWWRVCTSVTGCPVGMGESVHQCHKLPI